MSDLFDWLGGLEPGPWSFLLVVVVGLALLAAWMSHMYCQYRKEIKRLEDRRLSQLQAWEQAQKTHDALLNRILEMPHLGSLDAEKGKSSDDRDGDDDSSTAT